MAMYLIGLTGNIATGKSTVRKALAERGAATVDADALAHEVMEPGTEVYREVVKRFGRKVVQPDGSLDRRALRQIVFQNPDPQPLHDLEQIIHPAVGALWRSRLEEQHRPVGVIEAIKLIEAGFHRECDELWVVTAPPAQQLARLMAKRGWSEEEASRIIRAQPPQSQKKTWADVLLPNDGDLKSLESRVEKEWRRIMAQVAGLQET